MDTSQILVLFFLLFYSYLLVIYFAGRLIKLFFTLPTFLCLFIAHIFIQSSYALIKTGGNSIAISILLIIFFLLFYNKRQDKRHYRIISLDRNFVILSAIGFIWYFIQIFSYYNFADGHVNLPFWDHKFYMQVAESFHTSGNENILTAKNFIFKDALHFAEPYRWLDSWTISFGLELNLCSTLEVYQLFYMPLILFFASFAIFDIAKATFKGLKRTVLLLILSTVLLFLFADSYTREIVNLLNSTPMFIDGYDPFSIAGYTKLCIPFALFITAFSFKEKNQDLNAALCLILITAYIQALVAFVALAGLFLLHLTFQRKVSFRQFAALILCIVFIGAFYSVNLNVAKTVIPFQLENNLNLEYLANFALKKAVGFALSYYNFYLIILIALWRIKIVFAKDLVILGIMYFLGILAYAIANSMQDSFQLLTNFLGIGINSVLIYRIITQSFVKTQVIFLLISTLGFIQLLFFSPSGYFKSDERIKEHVSLSDYYILKKNFNKVKNPIGLFYCSSISGNENEYLWKQGTLILKAINSNLDVINYSEDPEFLEFSKTNGTKVNLQLARNAFHIHKRLIELKKIQPANFLNCYPFEYCISRNPKYLLPKILKEKVKYSYYCKTSKIYYHFFTSQNNN